MKGIALAGAVLAATAFPGGTGAADTPQAEDIMKSAHMNLYYPGDDGRAFVRMTMTDKRGKTREREFVMVRRDLEDGGAQKYFVYFLKPADVRRTAFMVWKDPQKDDSRWIYVPAIDLVKRISAKDKGSSFVGSDFSYEDVSGRHWTDDDHAITGEEEIDGTACWIVESTPRGKDSFSRKVSWVSKEDAIAVREEYYDRKDRRVRVLTAGEIRVVDGHPTVTKRTARNEKKNHTTTVEFFDIAYDLGVDEKIFTERYLKSPPGDLVSR